MTFRPGYSTIETAVAEKAPPLAWPVSAKRPDFGGREPVLILHPACAEIQARFLHLKILLPKRIVLSGAAAAPFHAQRVG